MSYTITEMFSTIQGEATHAGRRAIFIRFAACNLWDGRVENRDRGKGACAKWCDTKFAEGDKWELPKIREKLNELWGSAGSRFLVLSGGEPTLQVDAPLIEALHDDGWEIAIETNGSKAAPVLELIDHVCVSPKLGPSLQVTKGNELKVVIPGHIDSREGWTWDALRALANGGEWDRLYVQPQDPTDMAGVEVTCLHGNYPGMERQYKQNVLACLAFIEANPEWRLSLQAHKYIDVP